MAWICDWSGQLSLTLHHGASALAFVHCPDGQDNKSVHKRVCRNTNGELGGPFTEDKCHLWYAWHTRGETVSEVQYCKLNRRRPTITAHHFFAITLNTCLHIDKVREK